MPNNIYYITFKCNSLNNTVNLTPEVKLAPFYFIKWHNSNDDTLNLTDCKADDEISIVSYFEFYKTINPNNVNDYINGPSFESFWCNKNIPKRNSNQFLIHGEDGLSISQQKSDTETFISIGNNNKSTKYKDDFLSSNYNGCITIINNECTKDDNGSLNYYKSLYSQIDPKSIGLYIENNSNLLSFNKNGMFYENYSIFCPNGLFAGLRPKISYLNDNYTEYYLDDLDHTVIVDCNKKTGTAIVIHLPYSTKPKDGQEYLILANKNVGDIIFTCDDRLTYQSISGNKVYNARFDINNNNNIKILLLNNNNKYLQVPIYSTFKNIPDCSFKIHIVFSKSNNIWICYSTPLISDYSIFSSNSGSNSGDTGDSSGSGNNDLIPDGYYHPETDLVPGGVKTT
jgi:hypothetical protein